MSKIVEKIRRVKNLYHTTGASVSQIKRAELELGLRFPEEYVDYLKQYGAISFYGVEWTGLNVDKANDVVIATKRERELNRAFPSKCFVLENQGIDGLITISDESGQVFDVQYDRKLPVCKSISEYLDICTGNSMNRRNNLVEEGYAVPSDAKKLCMEVTRLASKYDANFYFVTDGAACGSNRDNPVIKVAMEAVNNWESED